jgi:hypothetical protein
VCARAALCRYADCSWRQVECHTRDRDRQWRGIDQRPRPDRPQHVADIAERAKRERGKNNKRAQEMSAVAAVRPAQMLTARLGKLGVVILA